jgi:hypothetical protein
VAEKLRLLSEEKQMANGHGGYRKPSNEKRAAVSNPGSGKRTDGMAGTSQAMRDIPSNGQYGYATETKNATQGAPLAGARSSGPSQAQIQARAAKPVTPLFAPDAYPDRPVTHGYNVGPGYTPEPEISDRYAYIKQYQEVLDTAAAQEGQSPAFQSFWNAVKAQARKN